MGSESMLARVSIVNFYGYVIYDTFVKPIEKVTDYRTWVSGVRSINLKNAPKFSIVQAQVSKLIKGKILIGHAIHNDLKALLLDHPNWLIRDTSKYKFFRELARTKFPSLKNLARLTIGIEVQKEGEEHNSIMDARVTMEVYKTKMREWEMEVRKSGKGRSGLGLGLGSGLDARKKVKGKRGANGDEQDGEIGIELQPQLHAEADGEGEREGAIVGVADRRAKMTNPTPKRSKSIPQERKRSNKQDQSEWWKDL